MLSALLEGWFKFPVGEAAFYSVFGFFFVFFGIVILILIFTLLGLAMKKVNSRPVKEKKKKEKGKQEGEKPVAVNGTEISPEVYAAITAAIICYLEETQTKCDFVVKRIRKI